MELQTFISILNDKPHIYRLVWIDILANYKNTVNVHFLVSKYKIPISSFYRIFKKLNTEILIGNELVFFEIKNSIIQSNSTIPQTKTKKRPEKKEIKNNNEKIKLIIDHLNMQSGKQYRTNSKTAIKFINARLAQGYTLEDFKRVIDVKCTKWLNTSMEQYLRPETLFSNKFEGYVNENIVIKKDRIDRIYEQINQTDKFN